jgi:predicted mannosyl-3-phosphoglycerate phosphatase (HAD superfamily)
MIRLRDLTERDLWGARLGGAARLLHEKGLLISSREYDKRDAIWDEALSNQEMTITSHLSV